MICPFCHNEIADTSLVCPFCDENVAVHAEREKCDAISKGWRNVLGATLHKPLFLVGLILMALINVALFMNIVLDIRTPYAMIIDCIPFVFAVLTLVSMIQVYAKKDAPERNDMKFLSMYMLWQYIGGIISTVLASFISVALLFVGFASKAIVDNFDQFAEEAMKSVGEEYAQEMQQVLDVMRNFKELGSTAILIICVLSAVILMFFVINYMLTFARANKFYAKVIASVDANVGQATIKAPVKRMYIFGVLIVLGGIGSVSITNFAGAATVALGGYLFVSGLLFNSIVSAYNAQVAAYNDALGTLTGVENMTSAFRAQVRMEHTEAEKHKTEQASAEAEPPAPVSGEPTANAEAGTDDKNP